MRSPFLITFVLIMFRCLKLFIKISPMFGPGGALTIDLSDFTVKEIPIGS